MAGLVLKVIFDTKNNKNKFFDIFIFMFHFTLK